METVHQPQQRDASVCVTFGCFVLFLTPSPSAAINISLSSVPAFGAVVAMSLLLPLLLLIL